MNEKPLTLEEMAQLAEKATSWMHIDCGIFTGYFDYGKKRVIIESKKTYFFLWSKKTANICVRAGKLGNPFATLGNETGVHVYLVYQRMQKLYRGWCKNNQIAEREQRDRELREIRGRNLLK